jgi:hypothetical protein
MSILDGPIPPEVGVAMILGAIAIALVLLKGKRRP